MNAITGMSKIRTVQSICNVYNVYHVYNVKVEVLRETCFALLLIWLWFPLFEGD